MSTITKDLPLVGRQVVAEQKLFWRNPAAAGFTIVFPVLFLIIFSALNGTGPVVLPDGEVMAYPSYFLPGIIVFAIVSACFTNLAINLTMRRDDGSLKRKRSTPLPMWALFLGLMGSETIVSVVLTVFTTALSVAFFDVAMPRHPVVLFGVVILGAATLCALGVAITALIPNQDAAPALVNVIAFPLLFLSGMFFPVGNGLLHQISNLLPLAPLQNAIADSFAPVVRQCQGAHCTVASVRDVVPVHAAGPGLADLAVVAIWLVAGALISVRTFRWVKKGE